MTRSFEEMPASPMRLYVCTTCRDADHLQGQGTPCAGARLFAALTSAPADPAVTIVPVECLSVCKRTCAVSFAAPGKWTYVYGDLPADTAADTILRGARLYAEAPDGLIPWKQRPDALKKGAVARIPALPIVEPGAAGGPEGRSLEAQGLEAQGLEAQGLESRGLAARA